MRNKHVLPVVRWVIAAAVAIPLAIWCVPQLFGKSAAPHPQRPLLHASDLLAGSSSDGRPAENPSGGVDDTAVASEAAPALRAAAPTPAAVGQSGVATQPKAVKAAGDAAAGESHDQPAAARGNAAEHSAENASAPSAADSLAQDILPPDKASPSETDTTLSGDGTGPSPAADDVATPAAAAGQRSAEGPATSGGSQVAASAVAGSKFQTPTSGESWEYWQQALISANATGLAPPVHRGNWMYAAHARLRWFEPNGKPRYMRPWTWWAYEDPAPPLGTQQAAPAAAAGGGEAAGSGTEAAGSGAQRSDSDRTREFTKRRWATDTADADASSGGDGSGSGSRSGDGGGSGSSKSAVESPQGADVSSGGSDDVDIGSDNLTADAERRRLRRLTQAGDSRGGDADEDKESADAWAIRTPPLQEKPVPDPAERSHYLPWIKRDLKPWAKRGIRQSDIDAAASLSTPIGPYCYGDQLLFQIVKGRLYIEFKTSNWNDRQMPDGSKQRYDGWFPGNEGPGLSVAKGRVPYVLFMLLDVLRAFPGQVPDVSGMIHTSDFPCLRVSEDVPDTDKRNPDIQVPPQHYDGRPIPVFGYNRKEGFLDLVLPDYSWYGHEYSQLTDPNGLMLNGWPQQLDVVVATHGATPLTQRLPKIMWRGRAETEPRDEVRRRFKACPEKLEAAGRADAQELFDVVAPKIYELTGTTLLDNGRYRYPVYIDAGAFSSNLKQKLAAGSPLLRVHQRYHEWYTRALVHGWTHVEVADNGTMCEDVYDKVTLMEEMVEEQAAAVAAAKHPPPWLQPRADSWFQQPWGVRSDNVGDAFQQLRDWTLAQRGIAVGGVNAYEDSDLYVAAPEAPEDADAPGGATAAEPGKAAEQADAAADRSADAGEAAAGAEGAQPHDSAAAEAEDAADTELQQDRRRQLAAQQAVLRHQQQWQATNRMLNQQQKRRRQQQRQRRRWRRRQRQLLQSRQQEAADAGRREWGARQRALRDAVPWGLWNRSRAAWGSDLLPWEIGAFGQMFARDQLRMHDLRLYVRDLLTEYSRLQRFEVKPSYHARCMDWGRMLAEFEWPHYSKDADKLLHFYPYITSPFNYNCSAELREADKPPYTPGDATLLLLMPLLSSLTCQVHRTRC